VTRAREHRAGRLLNPGAGRIEQPDERHPLAQGHLAQPTDLELAGHAHRARHHREVVGGDAARPPVDVAPAGDHAVGGGLLAVHRPLGGVRPRLDAELDERSGVDEQVDPLASRELAALVLKRDLFLAATELRLLATRVEVLDQWAHPGFLAVLGAGGRLRRLRLLRRVGHLLCFVAGLGFVGRH
jgi:hypothetical protein